MKSSEFFKVNLYQPSVYMCAGAYVCACVFAHVDERVHVCVLFSYLLCDCKCVCSHLRLNVCLKSQNSSST